MFGHGKGCKCMMCGVMFGKSDSTQMKCNACGTTFSSSPELEKHAKDKHKM